MAGATLRTLDYSVLQQCMHCGMCLPTCPTYDTTRRERNSPRGRIALMRAIADGSLGVTHEFARELSYCLGCLACQTACPAGVNYAELFEAARSDIELSNAHPGLARKFWRGLTLGFLFMHPRALRAAGRMVGFYQRSGLESLVRRAGLMKLLPPRLRRLEPQTPRIAPPFSNARIAPHETPAAGARYRVAMLTGCVQDLVFPDVNRDTVDVLLANGCAVDTPPAQPCCDRCTRTTAISTAPAGSRVGCSISFRWIATTRSSATREDAAHICGVTARCSRTTPSTGIAPGCGMRSCATSRSGSQKSAVACPMHPRHPSR
jgi:glycolate oxidase iron-sulfur subunit